MPALSFQQRFVPAVEAGEKTHTIRAERKRPFECGDKLFLYTGMRTKDCRKLFDAVCTRVERITIDLVPQTLGEVTIDGESLDQSERDALAKRDGFADWIDMLAFWEGQLPFSGQVIHWRKTEVNHG